MTDVEAADLPDGTVVFADGQLWTAQAGHEKTGLRWQQANGHGSASDRYMDMLFADRWDGYLAAGPSRVIKYGASNQAGDAGALALRHGY